MRKPINARVTILSAALAVSYLNAAFIHVSAAPTEPAAAKKATSAQKLYRADFRVAGASCVACLRRIGKTMREQKGAIKGDVSIFKPYWAVMIYDHDQTSLKEIFESVAKEKVKFEDIEDKPISAVPLIVIPKGLNETHDAAASTGGGAKH